MSTNDSKVSRVVVVNGNKEDLEPFEAELFLEKYFVDFINPSYDVVKVIKRLDPQIIILFVRYDHARSIELLNILHTDPMTSGIRTLMVFVELDLDDLEEEPTTKTLHAKTNEDELPLLLAQRTVDPMN